MRAAFDKVLNALLLINQSGFTDTEIINDNFFFKYGGGEFTFVKTISPDLQVGYLNLYHIAPFEIEQKFIEVKDFSIKINQFYNNYNYRMTNHLEISDNRYGIQIIEDNYFAITLEELIYFLPIQVRAKLISDNFKIYIK